MTYTSTIYIAINAATAVVGLGTLVAVLRQGNLMKKQLGAFIESQKPQLALTPYGTPTKDIFDSDAAHFKIAIANTGLTVAYDCTYESWIEVLTPPFVDFTDSADHYRTNNGFSLYPNHESIVINLVLRKGIPQHQHAMIRQGELAVCFRVKINYRDAFTPVRYSNFAFMMEGLGFTPLPKYNDSN